MKRLHEERKDYLMKPTFRRWRSWVGPSAATAITVSLVAAMSVADATGASAATRKHATASKGAVVTMAEGAQGTPNNIMPFVSGANNSQANTNLQEQMWPTLYTIGTASNVNAINAPLSLADPPVYSNGDTQVSVTLKPYKWSDGTALTARDVTFFMNILKANKTSWAHYTPGDMPTNVVSWTAKGANTVVFKLNRAYNPTWFTDDELAYIVPLPQHAWDKESATGAVGTYDLTTAGAKAVYSFLNTQGENTATYGSNPLWQVVDGAWKIKQYTSNGFVALVPNTAYSGPDKPKIAKFEEEPFTSSTAEFNALLGGNLDIGYVPLNDLAEKSRVQGAGYRPVRSELVAVNMLSLNYYSPVVGPLVKQVYIRQALNDVMDQPAQISAILHGTGGYVDFGPIPTVPKTPYMAAIQKKSPFDVSAARKLLTSHGWKIPSNGAAECVRPGTGSSECGAGIAKGKTLTFSLVYVSGSGYLTATMENYKSDASEVGIVLNLSQQPFNSIVGDICGTPTCDSPGWQIANWGAGFSWNFGSPYPVGATMFEGHVGLDYPVPKKLASLITATETAPVSKTAEAMKAYDSWVIKNDPEVWQIETYTLNAVSNKLKGVTFYPVTGNVFPQDFVVK
ncbi:MAG: ABC transporter substrate-binding protein [Actinomycetota bacterium]|nr:ABC transporter substrate-binding protein [Actinomycetota bacterium]